MFLKKGLIFLFVIILCFSLVACGESSTSSNNNEGVSTTTEEENNSTAVYVLNEVEYELYVGESFNLQVLNAQDKSIQWSSSNTSVATVDSNGIVSAISNGSARIVAEIGEKRLSCNIIVKIKMNPVAVLEIDNLEIVNNKYQLSLLKGDSYLISPNLKYDNQAENITYTISNANDSIVDISGLTVTASAVGNEVITVNCSFNSETISVEVNVIIDEVI